MDFSLSPVQSSAASFREGLAWYILSFVLDNVGKTVNRVLHSGHRAGTIAPIPIETLKHNLEELVDVNRLSYPQNPLDFDVKPSSVRAKLKRLLYLRVSLDDQSCFRQLE
jgi:hypothetical protein